VIIQIFEVYSHEEARALADLGVDHVGVLVGSKGFDVGVSPKCAASILSGLPSSCKGVVLTLSSNLAEILELVNFAKPRILQLQALPNQDLPATMRAVKKAHPYLQITRAVPVVNDSSIDYAKTYEGVADFLLLDTVSDQFGATGQAHNWDISARIVKGVAIPAILAGGLGPDNVVEAVKRVRPFGVDSKTRTDTANGLGKDLEKVRQFVEQARSS